MKTLPDNAHLDHLRRQAKDLLAGLRDTDPAATLADAQASIAEQYGFRTWTDLKDEVDRRRGSDTADPALAKDIAARFGLGTVTGAMTSVTRPDEAGRRWTLETDRGRWSPRTVDDVFPQTDGEDNARFQEAALRAGVTLPAPVRSTSGAVTERIGGHSWRVHEWLRSGPPLAAPVSATVTREVGRILATLHALALPAERICPWNAIPFEERSWTELADLAAGKGAAWAPALYDAAPTLAGLDTIGEGSDPGTPVMCHNNIAPGTVRIGAEGRLIVTGWEHADGLPPVWELCYVLAAWAVNPNGGISAPAARALLDGYGGTPPLSLDSFRGAAIAMRNYVSGQVHVALSAEGAEDARFADRNIRHLLTHLPSRETYEQLLDAVRQR